MYAIDEIYFLDSRTTKNFKEALTFINFFFNQLILNVSGSLLLYHSLPPNYQ